MIVQQKFLLYSWGMFWETIWRQRVLEKNKGVLGNWSTGLQQSHQTYNRSISLCEFWERYGTMLRERYNITVERAEVLQYIEIHGKRDDAKLCWNLSMSWILFSQKLTSNEENEVGKFIAYSWACWYRSCQSGFASTENTSRSTYGLKWQASLNNGS